MFYSFEKKKNNNNKTFSVVILLRTVPVDGNGEDASAFCPVIFYRFPYSLWLQQIKFLEFL